jgi:hypothetical protein
VLVTASTATTAAAAVATTATAATAVAAAATATAAAAAATRTRGPFAGLIHGQRTSVDLLSVESGDRGLKALVRLHLHEPKSAGPSGLTV